MKQKLILELVFKHFLLLLLLFIIIANIKSYGQNRTVALVFDDSGSMRKSNRFQAVNYALQVIVGLLNPDDSLYVVRMNNPDQSIKIDLHDKQKEITKIKKWRLGKNTPFLAVDTAMKVLENETKIGQDKWLIVFTDGEMNISNYEQKRINKFLTTSGAKSILLNINIAQNTLSTVFRNSGLVDVHQSPDDFRNITGFMEKISLSVMSMTQSGLKVNFSKNSVKVDTVLPLKRLIVLEQDNNKQNRLLNIKEVLDDKGMKIHIAGIYYSEMPNRLYGKITHISYKKSNNQVIPKGSIKINFDRNTTSSQLKFLPEVAARLTAKPSHGYERKIGNVYEICDKINEIEVSAEIKTFDGNPLPPNLLAQTKVTIHYDSHDEDMILRGGNAFFKTIKVSRNELPVSVSSEFPGYFNFRTNIFRIKKIHCKEPDVLGVIPANSHTFKVTELEDGPFLKLKPILNGRAVTPDEFKNLSLLKLNDPLIDLKIEKVDDYWSIGPKTSWCTPCFAKTGEYEILFEIRSSKKDIIPVKETIRIIIQDVPFLEKCGPLILWILILLFFLWYIFGLIKKSRFCKGSEIIYQRSTKFVKNKEISSPLKGKFINRYLTPYKPETAKVQGIKFKAGKRCSYIELPKEAQADNMYISGNLIEDPRKRDQRISIGDDFIVEQSSYKESYKYTKL